MVKSTIKNQQVDPNFKNRTIDKFSSSKKINSLLTMLRDRFDRHLIISQIHMLKWIDNSGYINIAFQVLEFQPVHELTTVNIDHHNTSCSLIFSQNAVFTMSISILHTSLKMTESNTEEENLGSYYFKELNETLIIEKFDQFINSIAA